MSEAIYLNGRNSLKAFSYKIFCDYCDLVALEKEPFSFKINKLKRDIIDRIEKQSVNLLIYACLYTIRVKEVNSTISKINRKYIVNEFTFDSIFSKGKLIKQS